MLLESRDGVHYTWHKFSINNIIHISHLGYLPPAIYSGRQRRYTQGPFRVIYLRHYMVDDGA